MMPPGSLCRGTPTLSAVTHTFWAGVVLSNLNACLSAPLIKRTGADVPLVGNFTRKTSGRAQLSGFVRQPDWAVLCYISTAVVPYLACARTYLSCLEATTSTTCRTLSISSHTIDMSQSVRVLSMHRVLRTGEWQFRIPGPACLSCGQSCVHE